MEYVDKFFCDLFGGDNIYQIGHLFAGFVLYILVMLIFKGLLNYFLNWKKCCDRRKRLEAFKKVVCTLFFHALSLDYAMSERQKKSKCDKQNNNDSATENDLAKYIKWNNRANLVASIVWCVVVFLIAFLTNKVGQSIALGMLIARLLSRVNEVSIAFVRDIGDSKNKSDLTSDQRLKLAITSLVEEAILFGALYGILACCGKWNAYEFICGALHGAYSIVPNINIGKSEAWNILSVFQCVSAMILISLAIASYLSNRKDSNAGADKQLKSNEDTGATTESSEEDSQGNSAKE